MNSFGRFFRIHTFGESHGPAVGVVIDGCPAGLKIDTQLVQLALDRRKPGQSPITTQRKESDTIQFLSGVFQGVTTGAPICMLVENHDQKSSDYEHLKDVFRPSHADFVYDYKYGIRDHRGGGRSSARETLARVAAGSIALQVLNYWYSGLKIRAFVSQVGDILVDKPLSELDLELRYTNPVRCPDSEVANRMMAFIEKVRSEGDTIGGVISCLIEGCPAGLGEPVFDKAHALLAYAMLGINAVKGFEYGSGFRSACMRGSEHNDVFYHTDRVRTLTNFSGGIQGGITNGEDIYFRVAFKPVATISTSQQTIDKQGNKVELSVRGRHDPCVVPRAVPIVEAMAALVLADLALAARHNRV